MALAACTHRGIAADEPQRSASTDASVEISAPFSGQSSEKEAEYFGAATVSNAVKHITELDGKVVKLGFKTVGDIHDDSSGYKVNLYNGVTYGGNQVYITAIFPVQARSWLSSLPRPRYVGGSERYDAAQAFAQMRSDAAKKWNAVYGVLRVSGSIRFEAIGNSKNGDQYTWQ